ncbi:glycosyltransferase [uncultured Polaribacter sp.]|uniref:glycosyltransferase n=1 Tax=uncultured Polaribacter sp. TaxID=174711 RepID=UPI00260F9162|nr:glycosyltransferase [uncultured Polaribacter sp.]
MKTGIIILFFNNENEITKEYFRELLNKPTSCFCLVNNASNDKTLHRLVDFKKAINNKVTVLDIKRNKGVKAAIKAGVRYLKNQQDFNSIIYFEFSEYKKQKHLKNILNFLNNENSNMQVISKTTDRKILKNVFSIKEIAY